MTNSNFAKVTLMPVPTKYIPNLHIGTPVYTPSQTLSDTTRYLCSAAYVDPGFASRVIEEVVEDEQRAIPPSYGFDLDPIVRHCFRARRMLLGRHAVVTLLVLIGLCSTPFFTIAWLALGGAIVAQRLKMNPEIRIRVVLAVAAVAVLACCLGGSLTALISSPLGEDVRSGSNLGDPGSGYSGTETWFQLSPVVLGLLTFVVLLLFRRHSYRVLVEELAYGAPASRPAVHSMRVERRLSAVAAAQRGNITVQAQNPFVGSGSVAHGWSFAITLRPLSAPPGFAADQTPQQSRIEVDGVELNRRVREALLGLRDHALPEGARVPGIFLTPHVVADGVRSLDDPLLNPETRMPHAMASDAAIEAITRSPQGGLRYYERAVVPGLGKAILTSDGMQVVPGQESGIEVAAFVHLAVEGGMLYAEFIGTVLAPVQDGYTMVDTLREERLTGRAFADTAKAFVTDSVLSPWWLLKTGWRILSTRRRMNNARLASKEYRSYDYGARFSVRELAAEAEPVKFLQKLDGWKYVKLMDKAVTDAVMGFLIEAGVDTAEFRSAVTYVRNEYTNVTNISGGQQNFGGANATFTQQNEGGSNG